MSKQAQVGAFALLALLLLFGVFYVITDFGTRHTGYRIGVHFQSAAGLHSGAMVYFSGVTVGTVDSITLLPDNTVDVILAINRDVDIPKASRFLIQAPLTGDPNLLIVPPVPQPRPRGVYGPTPAPPAVATLERRVLPIDEQPQGTNTATIADLLQQGQGEIKRLDAMLGELERREPQLISSLQTTLDNANDLTLTAKNAISTMSTQLQSSLAQASSNIVALTGTLNDTTKLSSRKVNAILTQLQTTTVSLNASVVSLQSLVTNKGLHQDIISSAHSIADTLNTVSGIAKDLRNVTGDPQTQAQLKNTIANADAAMQRVNSLLGAFGATSSVYGVDEGATPFPQPSGAYGTPYPYVTPPPAGVATPFPTNKNGGLSPVQIRVKRRLASLARNLIAIQLRLSALNAQTVCCPNPRLTNARGPSGDLNAVIFPRSSTSLLLGANDVGHGTTANLALIQSMNKHVRVGGGVLYSQLGLLGEYNAKVFGLEGRLFDLQRPELDLYGNLNVAHGLQIFVGERAINHAERRFTYGVQAQLP